MGHTCRGTINLATANIAVEDSCNFVISNGGTQTYHLKASSEVERQRWITALELAKAKAFRMQAESGQLERKPHLRIAQKCTLGGFCFTVFVPLFFFCRWLRGWLHSSYGRSGRRLTQLRGAVHPPDAGQQGGGSEHLQRSHRQTRLCTSAVSLPSLTDWTHLTKCMALMTL